MTEKRDLKADLELCHGFAQELETAKYRPWGALNATYNFAHKAREGWPHAIERAIEAETLVRELVELVRIMHETVITLLGCEDVSPEVVEKAKVKEVLEARAMEEEEKKGG